MLNQITLQGRVANDIQFKETDSYKQARFTIACERDFSGKDGKRETDFIRVVCWGGTADFAQKYFNRGDLMALVGRLQVDVDRSDNGYKEYVSVVAEHIYFCGAKKSDDEPRKPKAAQRPVDVDDSQERFREINGEEADEDLPF